VFVTLIGKGRDEVSGEGGGVGEGRETCPVRDRYADTASCRHVTLAREVIRRNTGTLLSRGSVGTSVGVQQNI